MLGLRGQWATLGAALLLRNTEFSDKKTSVYAGFLFGQTVVYAPFTNFTPKSISARKPSNMAFLAFSSNSLNLP